MSLFERASSLFSTAEAAAGSAAPLHWYESTYAIVGFGVAAAVIVLYLVPLAWQYLTAPAHLREVDGKHAFITGGSSGIGKALAIKFARRGANVTIAARNIRKLLKAKAEIEAAASEARKGRTEGWARPNKESWGKGQAKGWDATEGRALPLFGPSVSTQTRKGKPPKNMGKHLLEACNPCYQLSMALLLANFLSTFKFKGS